MIHKTRHIKTKIYRMIQHPNSTPMAQICCWHIMDDYGEPMLHVWPYVHLWVGFDLLSSLFIFARSQFTQLRIVNLKKTWRRWVTSEAVLPGFSCVGWFLFSRFILIIISQGVLTKKPVFPRSLLTSTSGET